ncbi:MAG: AMP-binding protein [Candidatus Eremiobacteraeota bacterium]|nr:AMP-binding protein [Candidatus Eremiobacteraeota bacterium]
MTRVEPETLADIIAIDARVDPERTAVIFEDRVHSYASLDAEIERAANALAASGVAPGDRVALLLPNDVPFIAALYAVARVGAIAVPLNTMYRAAEIAHLLDDSEPVLSLVHASLWDGAREAFAGANRGKVAIAGATSPLDAATNAFDWDDVQRRSFPRPPYAPSTHDPALICYTGGTTGRPKGAVHSHASLLANCRQTGSMLRATFLRDDRSLVSVPLFHMYGLQSGLNRMFRVGGSVVLMPRFDHVEVLRKIERYRCSYLLAAPPMLVRWCESTELREFDLRSLRIVTCGTAPLAARIIGEFAAATGVSISESYGMTEAGPPTHSNSNGPFDKVGTVGPPVPLVECRVVDASGADVARGEPGEIVLRSPALMLGYWRNPAATEETIRDGWLYTGDIAVVDEDGYYTIVDRAKDMISAGGFKIWPREVEDALGRHPDVLEAAVVGMPDRYRGEVPLGYVVLRGGARVTPDELLAFLREGLATFKIPARLEFVDALPRTAVGKVLRRDLRDRAHKAVVPES